MPTSEMRDEPDFRPPQTPDATVHQITRPTAGTGVDPLDALSASGYLGTKDEIEGELDLIAGSIRTFHRMQPDQVMRYCAGFSARLTEMAVLLHRVESTNRQYTRVRTQQVQRYLDELERQFKVASRLVEVLRQDLALIGGQS